jgi:hypothetical protein
MGVFSQAQEEDALRIGTAASKNPRESQAEGGEVSKSLEVLGFVS